MNLGRSRHAASGMPALARADLWVLLGLVLVTLAYRILTTPMIQMGGGPDLKWYYAKTWLAQLAGGDITNHHAARMAINTLIAAFQSVFGTDLVVYYLPAFSMSVAQVIFVYLLCRRAAGIWAGVLACLLVILHPLMVRSGAQLLPEIFSGTFVIASFCALSRSFVPQRGRIETNIVVAALLMFCAYLSKITTVLFLPACVLAVWATRRSRKDVGLFIIVFAALGLLEYLYYLIMVDGAWLGQLSIMSGHLSLRDRFMALGDPRSEYHALTWLDLPLRRYAPSHLGGIAPAVAFYAACVCATYLLLRERRLDGARALVAYAFLSYVVINPFVVTGIDPLVLAERFLPRYLSVVVPLASVITVFAAGEIGATLARLPKPTTARRQSILAVGVTTSLVMGFVYAFHNANRPHYIIDAAAHPFVIVQGYQEVVDDARARCVPFVVEPETGRRITNRMFSDRFHPLTWEKLKGSEFDAVGFPEECTSRYPDLRAYVDAQGHDGSVDAVVVAQRGANRSLFVERRRLPIQDLIPDYQVRA